MPRNDNKFFESSVLLLFIKFPASQYVYKIFFLSCWCSFCYKSWEEYIQPTKQ